MTDIVNMTEEEVRIRIAKELGLKPYVEAANLGCHVYSWVEWNTPDWTADLNAVYKLEYEVPEDEERNYFYALLSVLGIERRWNGDDDTLLSDEGISRLIKASSLDRCRAWLVWKERNK